MLECRAAAAAAAGNGLILPHLISAAKGLTKAIATLLLNTHVGVQGWCCCCCCCCR